MGDQKQRLKRQGKWTTWGLCSFHLACSLLLSRAKISRDLGKNRLKITSRTTKWSNITKIG
jgi:hypothetical protein